MKYFSILFAAIVLFSSCQKEDEKVTLPSPGAMQQMVAVLGNNYDQQVYVSLANKSTVSRPYRAYDLAFETLNGNLRVWTNSGKIMLAARTGTTDMAQADSVGKYWWVDNEQYHPDSSAIGNWWQSASQSGTSEVMIVDRGSLDYSGHNRFRKFQIISAGPYSDYHIRYSLYDNSELHDFIIPRDTMYSLVYFSFDNNGQLVNQAPPKEQWDFVFTKYTHVYHDYPYGAIFRNYPVVGAQLNIWDNVKAIQLQKDTFPGYMPYEDFAYGHVYQYPWHIISDVIGYNWKSFDINNNRFYVYPYNFFVVCDHNGIYYKLRMLDFYDQNGIKGTVTFEFQRI
jgi:hypothetical protein